MAWSAPIVHSVGDILTASDWNISSNDISFLGGTAAAEITTTQTTTTTAYVDLATIGPAVTVTTGANALVLLTSDSSITVGGDVAAMGCAVSGATTIAAPAGTNSIYISQTSQIQTTCATFIASLTPGSNTFTAKYGIIGGGTGSWSNRTITVIPLP